AIAAALALATPVLAHPTDPAAHPRPDLRRSRIALLDGEWTFAFDPQDQGLNATWFAPDKFPAGAGSIRVPFPWQSPLSGVAATGYRGVAWYARRAERTFPLSPGERLFLRFGAVDHEARIWVNGAEVGNHAGGYLPFECDVTAAFAGAPSAWIVVRVFDDN